MVLIEGVPVFGHLLGSEVGGYFPSMSLIHTDFGEVNNIDLATILWFEEVSHQTTANLTWIRSRFVESTFATLWETFHIVANAKSEGKKLKLPLKSYLQKKTNVPRWLNESIERIRKLKELECAYEETLNLPLHAIALAVLEGMIDCELKFPQLPRTTWLDLGDKESTPEFLKNLRNYVQTKIEKSDRGFFEKALKKYKAIAFREHRGLSECYKKYKKIVQIPRSEKVGPNDLVRFILNPHLLPLYGDNEKKYKLCTPETEYIRVDPRYSPSKRFEIVTHIFGTFYNDIGYEECLEICEILSFDKLREAVQRRKFVLDKMLEKTINLSLIDEGDSFGEFINAFDIFMQYPEYLGINSYIRMTEKIGGELSLFTTPIIWILRSPDGVYFYPIDKWLTPEEQQTVYKWIALVDWATKVWNDSGKPKCLWAETGAHTDKDISNCSLCGTESDLNSGFIFE